MIESVSNAEILRTLIASNPSAPLHHLQQAHPRLQSLSLDHLGLLFERHVAWAEDDHGALFAK